MINTLIIDSECQSVEVLRQHLGECCPQLEVNGVACTKEEAFQEIQKIKPELIFAELEMITGTELSILEFPPPSYETILLSASPGLAVDLAGYKARSCLQKPIQSQELVNAVYQALHWIQMKQEQLENRRLIRQLLLQSPLREVVGIPTLGSIEFLRVGEIIRCEGLQRYTRVVIDGQPDLISSYSIGQFQKLLEGYGFIATHKSHLINRQHIRRFLIEGTLVMCDGSTVPVSRRRRHLFLDQINHL